MMAMASVARQKFYEIRNKFENKKREHKTHLSRRKIFNGLLVRRSLFVFIHNIKYLHISFDGNQALHITAWQSKYENPSA